MRWSYVVKSELGPCGGSGSHWMAGFWVPGAVGEL